MVWWQVCILFLTGCFSFCFLFWFCSFITDFFDHKESEIFSLGLKVDKIYDALKNEGVID